MILATQRPSVNVITGMIKANFPARVAFRVSQKTDSRTILDANGADQLIGKGDMLYTVGNDMIRLQCAFVDTPEVDRIANFIGAQKGKEPYLLPEVKSENEEGGEDFDPRERDSLFEEAAQIIVQHQQGSTSLLQRRLNLGYNRAGRLIDQLERAGIVGPFKGSKAREVLVSDILQLEEKLKDLDKF
jgi:S-DNA-T family DNA segregation ATPase FtsK/SpoIIIE